LNRRSEAFSGSTSYISKRVTEEGVRFQNHRALFLGLEWAPEWARILGNNDKSQNSLEKTFVSIQAAREYLALIWRQYQLLDLSFAGAVGNRLRLEPAFQLCAREATHLLHFLHKNLTLLLAAIFEPDVLEQIGRVIVGDGFHAIRECLFDEGQTLGGVLDRGAALAPQIFVDGFAQVFIGARVAHRESLVPVIPCIVKGASEVKLAKYIGRRRGRGGRFVGHGLGYAGSRLARKADGHQSQD
jgi:hypothetical protein